MKILVVGCGKVGSEIARDLSRESEVDSVTAVDARSENLKKLRKLDRVIIKRLDISQRKLVQRTMQNADLVCGALPGRIGFEVMRQAAQARRDLVDISYTPENPFKLHNKVRNNENILVPQCGVAPGLTNMFVGDASRQLGSISGVRIFVGGLPQTPVAPLNYRVVFSLEDVINEYSRPVNLIENGRRKTVEPLSGRGILNFPGVGKLEYFLTDGLGSLPRSFPRAREMLEYTLRYPGHADMMETLRALGFFDRTKMPVNGFELEPRGLTIALLARSMSQGTPEDLLALRVLVKGGSHNQTNSYRVLDYFDRRNEVSAMARTTAYPCTSVALLVGKKKLKRVGVVPPEQIAKDGADFAFVLSRLRRRGIKVQMQN